MNAQEAARRTKAAEQNNAKELWKEMWPKILEQIERQTDNRCWALHIDRKNEVNKHDVLFYTCVREYWVAELEKMGFKCQWQYDAEDRDGCKLIVSWEHLSRP